MARYLYLILLAFMTLTACGQTGDLYWPEEEQTEINEEEGDKERE